MESEAPNLPDDEFDEYNDETFGDGGEYTWEDTQNVPQNLFTNDLSNGTRLAQPKGSDEDSETFDTGSGNRRGLGEFDNYERQSREYDDLENNENALEESISRLVLDDYEDDEEAISSDKLRRIAANRNSYAYFMPPQVVNRHLQWFMDKDLPGGSSLLGSSVWSMHPTSITPKAADAVPSTSSVNDYSTLKSPESSSRNNLDIGSSAPHALPAGSDLGNLLGLVRPKEPSASRPPPGLNNVTPAFKTVDEIEQEMLRESEMRHKPAEVKHEVHEASKAHPKIMSVEELERELIQESVAVQTPPPGTPVQAQAALSGIRPQGQYPSGPIDRNQAFEASRMSLPFPSAQPSSHPTQAAASSVPITSASSTGPGPMGFPRHQMNVRPVPPRGFPNNFAQNLVGLAAHQAAALQQLHNIRQQQVQQQQLRFLQQQMNATSHSFRPVGFPLPPNQRNLPLGFPLGPLQMNNAASAQRRQEAKIDEGLMTEKDKQRLKNIQIVQLQNDHPHTTDYYCLMRRVRQGGSGHPPMDLLRMLFPRKTDDDENNRRQYEPAHFENSLGKLQAQSALAPKKAIDTVIRVVDSGPVAGKKKSYRYLLLEIEKIYDCLLALEEADLRVALHTSGNDVDEREIAAVRTKVENVLQNPKKLSEMMSVRKGKFLVCRLVALIDQPCRMVAVRHLFKTFPTWSTTGSATVTPGSSELIEMFPYMRHCILNMDTRSIESIAVDLTEDLLESFIVTKLGTSLLMVLLHQGEKLISTSSPPVTDQFKTIWNRLFVVPILAAILKNKESVAPPLEIYNIGLQRLLTSDLHRLNAPINEELTKLLNGFLNSGTKLIKQDY